MRRAMRREAKLGPKSVRKNAEIIDKSSEKSRTIRETLIGLDAFKLRVSHGDTRCSFLECG